MILDIRLGVGIVLIIVGIAVRLILASGFMEWLSTMERRKRFKQGRQYEFLVKRAKPKNFIKKRVPIRRIPLPPLPA